MWNDATRFDAALDGTDRNSVIGEFVALLNEPASSIENRAHAQLLSEFAAATAPRRTARRAARTAVIGVAAAALIASGVGLAAAHKLPWQEPQSEHSSSAVPRSQPTSAQDPSSDDADGRGQGVSEQGLDGLCRAYAALPPRAQEKALRSEAFEDLVRAAGGGADEVVAFCEVSRPEPTHPTGPPEGNGPPTTPGGGPEHEDDDENDEDEDDDESDSEDEPRPNKPPKNTPDKTPKPKDDLS